VQAKFLGVSECKDPLIMMFNFCRLKTDATLVSGPENIQANCSFTVL